jgi:hypothetical protein
MCAHGAHDSTSSAYGGGGFQSATGRLAGFAGGFQSSLAAVAVSGGWSSTRELWRDSLSVEDVKMNAIDYVQLQTSQPMPKRLGPQP